MHSVRCSASARLFLRSSSSFLSREPSSSSSDSHYTQRFTRRSELSMTLCDMKGGLCDWPDLFNLRLHCTLGALQHREQHQHMKNQPISSMSTVPHTRPLISISALTPSSFFSIAVTARTMPLPIFFHYPDVDVTQPHVILLLLQKHQRLASPKCVTLTVTTRTERPQLETAVVRYPI